jgi:hypothetical protein
MEINKHAVETLLLALYEDARRCLDSKHDSLCHHLNCLVSDILSELRHRGPRVLLIHLPEVGKMFDKGLSSSFDWAGFSSSDHTRFSRRSLKHVMYDVFDDVGRTRDEITADDIFFVRQFLYLFKKYSIDCPFETTKETVNDFVKIDQGLREPSGSWNSDHWYPGTHGFCGDPVLSGSHPRAEKLWRTVDHVFGSIVPMHEVDRLRVRPRHGPGAVADMKTGGDKYLFPFWPSKLESQFPFVAFGQHREDLHITEEMTSTVSRREPPARLIAVPKTFKGPRLIASEPIAHQFLQQGLMVWLREHLSPYLRNSIDFSNQEKSRLAALEASRRGDLATVDLSSASDRLSCWTVERALASNQSLLECLHAVRTRCIIDATGTAPDLSLQMRKFAAQGSAVTFPIQTLIYTGLSIAACLFYENLKPTGRNIRRVGEKIRVFGDDIIIPRKCVPILTLMLDSLQLKVNGHKTHTSGSFRESCGMDGWRGHDVTPVYLQACEWNTSPEKIQSWYDVSNNAHKKGLWVLADALTSSIPNKFRKKSLIAHSEGDGLRLFSFCRGFSTQAQCRYSQHLHRDEYRVFTIRSLVHKKGRRSWNDLYQYLIEAPDPQSKWSHGYITKKTSKIQEVWVAID